MSERDVTSRSYMKRPRRPLPQLPRWVRLMRPLDFTWAILLAGLVYVLEVHGTPHVLVSYSYAGSRAHKTSCTYYGIHSRTLPAENAGCPFITLLR